MVATMLIVTVEPVIPISVVTMNVVVMHIDGIVTTMPDVEGEPRLDAAVKIARLVIIAVVVVAKTRTDEEMIRQQRDVHTEMWGEVVMRLEINRLMKVNRRV